MSIDEEMFFQTMPQMLPLYAVLKEKLQKAYPEMKITVAKTQISFRSRYVFAVVSLPWRRQKGWPERYMLVSFGLAAHRQSPRIRQAVEAYPGRWTHHVVVQTAEEIDRELLDWIHEAYLFSMAK